MLATVLRSDRAVKMKLRYQVVNICQRLNTPAFM